MICWVGDRSPPAFVLRELELHESKRGIEPKLDQGEVPSERLESFHRKYQFLRTCHMHTSGQFRKASKRVHEHFIVDREVFHVIICSPAGIRR